LESYFIAGTDTDVGKTFVTAGLALAIRKLGIDVGIMKPFAAGTRQKNGFKSEDVQILADAAQINDSEDLLNPQFFPIDASPFTASKNLNLGVDVNLVLTNFRKLTTMHEMMLVEGMGGIMTPILKNYFVTNLIKDMKLDVILITRTRIGTVNHTIMTCAMCKHFGISLRGIIINNIDDGYSEKTLQSDFNDLLDVPTLCTIPKIANRDLVTLSEYIEKKIDLKKLLF